MSHNDLFMRVKELLGKPYVDTENALIYNVDSLVALTLLPDKIIDLIITSPPYNIGKAYEKVTSTDVYVKWCSEWLALLPRITKNNGAFWLNLGYLNDERGKCLPISYLLWDKVPFYLMQEVVWNYSAGVACKNYFSPRNEKFLWYVRDKDDYTFNLDEVRDKDVKYPNQKKDGKLRTNPNGKNPSDVWAIPKVTSGTGRASKERTPHPAQFPCAVIDRIIKACSNTGDIILDPFMGSGTTAVVALANGRKVIGFEINKDYCEIIKQRILEN